MSDRFWSSFWFAALAGMIAHTAGVPWWSTWKPGDASDFMLAGFWFAWFALPRKVIVNNIASAETPKGGSNA